LTWSLPPLLEQTTGNVDASCSLEYHWTVLNRYRCEGIEAVFTEHSELDQLRILLDEIIPAPPAAQSNLFYYQEMPVINPSKSAETGLFEVAHHTSSGVLPEKDWASPVVPMLSQTFTPLICPVRYLIGR